MKFRRTLRRDMVMRRLAEFLFWGDAKTSPGTHFESMEWPCAEARAGAQLPQDERSAGQASPEGARQGELF